MKFYRYVFFSLLVMSLFNTDQLVDCNIVLNTTGVLIGAAGLLVIGAVAGGVIGYAAGKHSGYSGYYDYPYGHYRGRRNSDSLLTKIDQVAFDDESSRCAARLICHLHQKPINQMSSEEFSLVQLFELVFISSKKAIIH